MEEIWKEIPGYEGLYDVSTHGQVRGLDRIIPSYRYGTANKKGKILVGRIRSKSLSVVLCKDGHRNHVNIYRLVAEVFIPNPENKPFVNHIDGNRMNNRLDNLEWVTCSENFKHAIKHGLFIPKRGEEHWISKLTEENVKQIRVLRKQGVTYTKMGEMFGVSKTVTRNACLGVTWRNVKN
jgi:NUMOD4 motif/HNH endonuclease